MPSVSVLMSVYNGERFLREAMDSILNQTFTDYEFIIIDDGSTDGSLEILNNYTDPRIRLVRNQVNIGLTYSLNKGLGLARGEYIARMDADDISLPLRFKKQITFLNEHPEVGILGTQYQVIDQNGFVSSVSNCPCHHHEILWSNLSISHPTVMMRLSIINTLGGYQPGEHTQHCEDYDLWVRAVAVTRLANLPEVLLKYRRHEETVSHKYQSLQFHNSIQVVRRSCSGLLGMNIGTLAAESIWKSAEQVVQDNEEQVREATRLIVLLLHSYVRQQRLVGKEKRQIYKCATNHLAKLAYINRKVYPFAALQAMFKAVWLRPQRLCRRRTWKVILGIRYCFYSLYGHSEKARSYYWDNRSKNIDESWGLSYDDYDLLARVINSLKATKILDVGCGSGRLFPLYSKLGIVEVIGQDVSIKALKIARQRYDYENIKTTNEDIHDLAYPEGYFDLVISNRVLQHIPPKDIGWVLEKLTRIGKRIYINEMSESDFSEGSFYMFMHNYRRFFEGLEFKVIENGYLGKQSWILFGKI